MEAADNLEPAPEPIGENAGEDIANESENENSTSLKGTRSLRRLRDRVERVAFELRTLREENTALQKRVMELEAATGQDREEGKAYVFDADPDALKKKIDGFIQAIDQYLEENGTSK